MSDEKKLIGKPFPKGVSGNPGGRPKGIDRAFRDEVAKLRVEGGDPEQDGWRALAKRVWQVAMGIAPGSEPKDCAPAAKLLLDRGWGPPTQHIAVTDGPPPSDIDWTSVPLEDRRRLLAAMDEVEQLATVAETTTDEPTDL